MAKPDVKGDEVRYGTQIYLDAVSQDVLDALSANPLSERILYHLNDDNAPLTPMSARQVAQAYKADGELVFALRLKTNNQCIGLCRLGDIGWKSRHAQLHIGILDEAQYTVDILMDVLQTTLQFAYWEANLNRVSMRCIEDHTLLQAALERAGFVNEGRLRQEVYRGGRLLDIIIYSVLQREWVNAT